MSDILLVNAFKVVRTNAHYLRTGGTESRIRSAQLNRSRALIDYGVTLPKNGKAGLLTQVNVPGTPHIAFDDAAAALDFSNARPGCAVYRLTGYATAILPVERVLKLNLGWERELVAFWEAVQAGADLKGFKTRSAPEHSIAIFGYVGLTERIYAVPVDAPGVPVTPALAEALGLADEDNDSNDD